MKSKRIKINFDTINGDNYQLIPQKDIAESNDRIKKEMKNFIRKMNKLLVLSFIISIVTLGCEAPKENIKLSKEEIITNAVEFDVNKKDSLLQNHSLSIQEIEFIDNLTTTAKFGRFDFIMSHMVDVVVFNVQIQTLKCGKMQVVESLNYLVKELNVNNYKFYRYNNVSKEIKQVYMLELYNNKTQLGNLTFYMNYNYQIVQIDMN